MIIRPSNHIRKSTLESYVRLNGNRATYQVDIQGAGDKAYIIGPRHVILNALLAYFGDNTINSLCDSADEQPTAYLEYARREFIVRRVRIEPYNNE